MSGEFVARMEDVLDLYHADYDPDHPVVCFDETSKQLVADKPESTEGGPWGQPLKKREGAPMNLG